MRALLPSRAWGYVSNLEALRLPDAADLLALLYGRHSTFTVPHPPAATMSEQKGDREDDFVVVSNANSPDEPMQEVTHPTAGSDEYQEPTYNIGDVRASLRQLRDELATQMNLDTDPDSPAAVQLNAEYCTILTTLSKVLANLLKTPVNPSHCSINLDNPAVRKKFGAYGGARKMLEFCGFAGKNDAAAGVNVLALDPASIDSCRTRIDRALVILNKVKHEHSPPPDPDADETMQDASSSTAAAIAPASVFLANADDSGAAPMEDTEGAAEAERLKEQREAMKPDLEPSYNIAEVRLALKQLYSEVEALQPPPQPDEVTGTITPFARSMHNLSIRDAYCSVLDTLIKITQNLLKTPVNPQHLRINLGNPVVRKKFAGFKGAVELLKFCGFRESTAMDEGDAFAAPVSPTSAPLSPSSDASSYLVLPESALPDSVFKITRALSILSKQRADSAPTQLEMDRRALGPIQRELRVWDLTQITEAKMMNDKLGAKDEVVDDLKPDMGLLLTANLAERKRVHEMSRTDVIITKQKQAEIKEAAKRKYNKTLIKITFTEKNMTQAQQGSGRYAPKSYVRGGGYLVGSKDDQSKPMETDGEEEKSALPSSAAAATNTNVASPPPAAAAAASSVASPPAPEILLSFYFRPWETLGDLFTYIQSLLIHGRGAPAWYLKMPPNVRYQCGGDDKGGKMAELRSKSLQSLGLVPAAAMFFHYVDTNLPPGSVVSSLRPEVLSMQQSYDLSALTALLPVAENSKELEEMKAKALRETREREKRLNGDAGGGGGGLGADGRAAASSGGGLGDDDDIEAYMRRKKAAEAKAKAASSSSSGGAAPSSSVRPGNSLGGSSTSGSAASNRVIPNLFKPKK